MPERAKGGYTPSTKTALPVFAFKFPRATNALITPTSSRHGMPCPYYRTASLFTPLVPPRLPRRPNQFPFTPHYGRRPCIPLEIKHNPPVHLPLLQPPENIVNRSKRLRLNRSLHFSIRRKRQRFFQIEPRSHDRPANRVAVQHHVKNRHRKISRRQSVQHARSAATQHSHRLLERDRRNSRHQHAMRSANLLLDFLRRVLRQAHQS